MSKPAEALLTEAVAGGGAFDLAEDEAGLAQHFEVLANGALGERDLLDDIVGDAAVGGGEVGEDLQPDRVAEGF